MVKARIDVPRNKTAAFCRRNGIKRLALFGSVLRDDFTPESDVDVLVEFEPGNTPGLKFITMQDELSEIYGRRVDLHTFRGVESNPNWLLRKDILDSAQAVYEQT